MTMPITASTPSSLFSPTIESFWQHTFLGGDVLQHSAELSVATQAELDAARRVMLLRRASGQLQAVCTPALAERLALRQQPVRNEAMLRERLRQADLPLHGADYLFHFSEADKTALLQEITPSSVRQLHAADAELFAAFQGAASEQDLDDAYVELDHWAVFGAFEQERLVCAASIYPWDGQQIADMGVLTLPPYRGKGHASRVVRAISRYALAMGYQPQYRCQHDNIASAALARSAGLSLFGSWEVISPDAAD